MGIIKKIKKQGTIIKTHTRMHILNEKIRKPEEIKRERDYKLEAPGLA